MGGFPGSLSRPNWNTLPIAERIRYLLSSIHAHGTLARSPGIRLRSTLVISPISSKMPITCVTLVWVMFKAYGLFPSSICISTAGVSSAHSMAAAAGARPRPAPKGELLPMRRPIAYTHWKNASLGPLGPRRLTAFRAAGSRRLSHSTGSQPPSPEK